MLDFFKKTFQSFPIQDFSTKIIKIVFILLIAYFFRRFSGKIVERIIRSSAVKDNFLTKEEENQRKDTLVGASIGAIKIIIWIVAGLMILSEIGISIGPLLATAGIAGIALGFGGQFLIRDLISGLFIILENQYRVGDFICIEGTCGLVEDLNLRMTIIRDMDGTVHHIPNGEIKKASNLSKYYARVNINIGISYDSNLEKVINIVNQVGAELADDPQWKDSIIKPPQFIRVEDFGDSAIIIKILGETKPLKQWEVAGELRKRIKNAFDRNKLEILFSQKGAHHSKS